MLYSIVVLKANINNFEIGLLLGDRSKEMRKPEKNLQKLQLGGGRSKDCFDEGNGGGRITRMIFSQDVRIVPILWCRAGASLEKS